MQLVLLSARDVVVLFPAMQMHHCALYRHDAAARRHIADCFMSSCSLVDA